MSSILNLKFCIIAFILMFTTCANGTIYRWVDSKGVIHFSEYSHPNATIENLESPQIFTPTPTPSSKDETIVEEFNQSSTVESQPAQAVSTVYTQFNFLNPQPEQTIHTNEGIVNASLTVSPALALNDIIEFYLDGQLITIRKGMSNPNKDTPPAASEQFDIVFNGVYRGTHTISARLLTNENQIAQEASVKFYVFQASKLSLIQQTRDETHEYS